MVGASVTLAARVGAEQGWTDAHGRPIRVFVGPGGRRPARAAVRRPTPTSGPLVAMPRRVGKKTSRVLQKKLNQHVT